MRKEISVAILYSFDEKENNILFNENMEETTAREEHINKRNEIKEEVKNLVWKNSDFYSEKNGRKIFDYLFDCAIDKAGEVYSWTEIYDWFCQFEEMVFESIKIFEIEVSRIENIHFDFNSPINLENVDLDSYIDRINNGENFDVVFDNFLTMIYNVSRFSKLSCGEKFHKIVIKNIDDIVYRFNDYHDIYNFAIWYSYFENIIATSIEYALN